MCSSGWETPLTAAGRAITNAGDLVQRHLGMSDPQEHWAAPLYDNPARSSNELRDEDLLATAALGVRVTKSSLAGFARARPQLERALAQLPPGLSLAAADDVVIERIHTALTATELEPTTVAKLLHRARPRLVPPYDRATSDWYARGLSDRDAGRLPRLLHHIRDDLRQPSNAASLHTLQQLIATENDGALVPSRLRLFDVAVWMAATAPD